MIELQYYKDDLVSSKSRADADLLSRINALTEKALDTDEDLTIETGQVTTLSVNHVPQILEKYYDGVSKKDADQLLSFDCIRVCLSLGKDVLAGLDWEFITGLTPDEENALIGIHA